jgi:hypothetical protein
MQYLSRRGLNRCVHDAATRTGFYSHQGIVIDKVMESNLLIGHKHGNGIYMIERFDIRPIALERLSPYLSIHIKNVQIGGHTNHVC